MIATLIGYFPKKTHSRPDWLKVPHVTEICSVSDCISKGPENWISHWKHNEMWVFDSVELCLSIIPPADQPLYDIYAYRLFPFSIKDGLQTEFVFPALSPVALGTEFRFLGFDAVSRSCGTSFECSPLSCNHMADQTPTNAHCLFDELTSALKYAFDFAAGKGEPGPYFVAEVFRREITPRQAS